MRKGSSQIYCGTDAYFRENHLTNLAFPRHELLETRGNIIIKVVVHIVYTNADENLPDQLVRDQIAKLNIDFTNDSQDKPTIPKEFRSSVGSPFIRFCLTNQDPAGKSSTGIIRKQAFIQNIGGKKDEKGKYIIHHSAAGGDDAWDTQEYLNIWVAPLDNIYGRSTIGGTTFDEAEDGIVIDSKHFGYDPAKKLGGRTLTHEAGHYFGLRHLWGLSTGDCNEDDDISDTPPQSGPYFDCPRYPQNSCDHSNMFMNYMDFTADECMDLFTKEQSKRMIQILNSSRPGLLKKPTCQYPINSAFKIDAIKTYYNSKSGLMILQSSDLPDDPIQLMLSNSLGQFLYATTLFTNPLLNLDLKDYPQGIYFLYFRYHNQQRIFKFLKP